MWLHQVGQHQQGLSVRGQPASARAPFPAPGREQAGQVAQGRIGEIDPRWVDKHVKLRADRLILIDNPSTRSITSSSTPLRINWSVAQPGWRSLSTCRLYGRWTGDMHRQPLQPPRNFAVVRAIWLRIPGDVGRVVTFSFVTPLPGPTMTNCADGLVRAIWLTAAVWT